MSKPLFNHQNLFRWAGSFALPLIISTLATVIWLLGDSVNTLLRYEMDAVNQGEVWRIFTANLTHSNGWHLLLNISGLWVMDYLFQQDLSRRQRFSLLIFCMLGNVALLHEFFHLKWYVGLSGALHGYLAGCAILSWRQARLNNLLILVGVSAKVILELNYEINTGTAELINANVVEEAHAMGLVAALIYCAGYWLFQRWQQKESQS